MCGHRLNEHDAANGFRCTYKDKKGGRCKCTCYAFQVQFDHEPVKCRCKKPAKDHEPTPPFARPPECEGFDSPWMCHCGHPYREHRTAFVRHKYAERAAFIMRANAAKAAGLPSWKAMQREAALHAAHGTEPLPYQEVTDMEKLRSTTEDKLEEAIAEGLVLNETAEPIFPPELQLMEPTRGVGRRVLSPRAPAV